MTRTAIFIDGAYLGKTLKKFGEPKVDFQQLSEKMANGADILRTYYYDCSPYQSNPPTSEERAVL